MTQKNTLKPDATENTLRGDGCASTSCSRFLNALRRLYEAADVYAALQDSASDPRCGITQPITVADGEELIAALCDALEILQAAEKEGWIYSANAESIHPESKL